jgi:uncharacterized membrane protein YphA (DoxX/SURF4 family)
MNSSTNSLFIPILKYLLGLVFIFSGISKLFPIHLTELNLVYHHIANWDASPYLSRALIIFEIILGIAIFMGISYKKITLKLSLIFTLLFCIYLVILLLNDGNSQNCGCFGNVLPMTPGESLTKNIVIIFILIILLSIPEQNPTKLGIASFLIIIVSVSSLILFYFPIYTWLTVNPTPKKTVPFDFTGDLTFSDSKSISLMSGKKLIGVFNTTCSNCREVAYKLGIVSKKHQFKNLYLLLVGDSADISDFIIETHLNYPYKKYTFFEFVKLYPHSTWPWIISSEDGIIKKQWTYETFDVKNFYQQLK